MERRDKREIKQILELIAGLDEGVAGVAALAETQCAEAAESMRAMTSREAEEILRGMDVENVNRDRLGIRVASLRAAGITDMEKLCALSVDQINEIKGISDDAAYLI